MAAIRLHHYNRLLLYWLLFGSYFMNNYSIVAAASEHGTDSIIERKLSSRLVNTKYGALRGYIATLPEIHVQQVEVFLGVPFASSPTGKLRFMPPVSSAPWNGVRLAHSPTPVCPQNVPSKSSYSNYNQNDNQQTTTSRSHWRQLEMSNMQRMLRNQSEDCLYLSIYSPLGNKSETQNPRPVLVFIHGESFEWSSGSVFDGTALAAYGDILVVTISYRLGALGFFPSLDGSSRGNFGLMDQVAALHWVQENIEHFGGNPGNVIIAGHGHGAACVHLLMISSMARGLFHKVVMQSGSAYSSWAFSSNALKYAYQLVEKVDCASTTQQTSNQTIDQANTNSQIMQCLRSKSVEQLLTAQRQIQAPLHLSAFGPTVDGLLVANNFNQNFINFNNFINQQAAQSANVHSSNHPTQAIPIPNNNISITTFQSFSSFTSNSASSIPLLIGLSRLDMRWNEFEAIFSSPEDRRNPLLLKEKAFKGLVKSLYTYHLNKNSENSISLPLNSNNSNNGLSNLSSLPGLSNLNYQALLQNRLLAAGFPPIFPQHNNLNSSNLNPSLHQQPTLQHPPTTGISSNLPVDSSSINSIAQQHSTTELNQNGSLLATLQSLYAAQSKVPISIPTTTNAISSPTITKTTNFTNYHKEVNNMNNHLNHHLNSRHVEQQHKSIEETSNHQDNVTSELSPVKEEKVNVDDSMESNSNNEINNSSIPITQSNTEINGKLTLPNADVEEKSKEMNKDSQQSQENSRPPSSSSNRSTPSNIKNECAP